LFGIATRNGIIMMITHNRQLLATEGLSLREAVVVGSINRLVPILSDGHHRRVGARPDRVRGG
jgi:Cu/Ag efflux pump CusA